MKLRLLGVIAGVLALLITLPAAVQAQDNPPASAQSTPVYSPQQLDQLLAPIALYPDQLLGQILMASTYPLEVVEAARWVQDPNNAKLKGDQLAAAVDQRDWDPSVKALVPFPRLLQMMSNRLDWMQQLGDAFLAQQADVMDSVQRLRQEAQAAGTLTSTPQQVVTADSGSIVIAPANPEVVYVPTYDPTVVYGAWPYPDYPPSFFPWSPGYAVGAGLFFGIGVAIVEPLWGWNDFDWRDHYVHIDVNRYNYIDRHYHERFHAPPIARDRWEHDPFHRHGVAYRDPALRERYTRPVPGSPDVRRNFRGYDVTPRTGPTPAVGRPAPGVNRRAPGVVQPDLRRAPGGPRARVTPPGAGVTPGTPSVQQPPTTTLGRPVPGVSRPTPDAVQPDLRRAPRGAKAGVTAPGAVVAPRTPSVSQPPTTTLRRPAPSRSTPGGVSTGPAKAPAGVVARPAPPGGKVSAPRAPSIQQPATIQRRVPPAFEGINRGPEIRAQGDRGRQSLQAIGPKGTGAAVPRATGGTTPRASGRGGNDKLKRR